MVILSMNALNTVLSIKVGLGSRHMVKPELEEGEEPRQPYDLVSFEVDGCFFYRPSLFLLWAVYFRALLLS